MVFDFFRGGGRSTIDEVEKTLVEMMQNALRNYEDAMDAVFGGGKSKSTKKGLKKTDREINLAQQKVRRDLMMHASVSPNLDLAETLAYMSVVKDVERVGDYAKNLYDLAKFGADFSAAADYEYLARYRDCIGDLIGDAIEVFETHNADAARELIAKADEYFTAFDDNVKAAFHSDGPASDAVARTLYFRFLKRITAHVMNLLTSLVAPIDRLDYYDEDPDDRVNL